MFCVVYLWPVISGREEEFRSTWCTITEAIFRQHGSCGSRLHRSDDGQWLAYAQWPDRQHWEGHAATLGVELAQSRQAECLHEGPKVLFKLTVTDDMLADAPFSEVTNNVRKTCTSNPPKFRVARPTDRMDEVVRFYRDGLGLQELGGFCDHAGFDGVMLGEPNSPYHLEFTHCHGHAAERAPTQDNLLIFYRPERDEWNAAVARMQQCGYLPVPSFNPYWDERGCTFEDPDGYRVVIENDDWDK